jgi:hypothetical protein
MASIDSEPRDSQKITPTYRKLSELERRRVLRTKLHTIFISTTSISNFYQVTGTAFLPNTAVAMSKLTTERHGPW